MNQQLSDSYGVLRMTPTDFNAQNAAEAARACDKLNALLADLEQCGCLVSISDGERVDRVALSIEFPVRPR